MPGGFGPPPKGKKADEKADEDKLDWVEGKPTRRELVVDQLTRIVASSPSPEQQMEAIRLLMELNAL